MSWNNAMDYMCYYVLIILIYILLDEKCQSENIRDIFFQISPICIKFLFGISQNKQQTIAYTNIIYSVIFVKCCLL